MSTTHTKCVNCNEQCKDRKAAATKPVNGIEKLAKMSTADIENLCGGK